MSPSKKQDMDYAIIGGGITGLTLAIALIHRGLSVKLYEQAPSFAEIGAGVSFSPNAVQAMKLCHPAINDAFERVRTRNIWESKQDVWFDYYDGYHDTGGPPEKPAFTIRNSTGQAGVHRAHFLDELIKILPEGVAVFGKRLDSVSHDDRVDGLYTLMFADGSTASAHAVLGCDGIKSRVRSILFGADHPCAAPTYTHKYAYRALVPMKDAIAVLGEEMAQNACMHMGRGGHVLTFNINHGQVMNVVAFHTTEKEWPDSTRLATSAKREDALRDFADFAPYLKKLLHLAKPELDIWAIFHLGDNPAPAFAKDRVCIIGDAAHASSPHHGAGAGMGIEDCAVLSSLLADESVVSSAHVAHALSLFDRVRRERGQWLVQSSQHIGNCYEWLAEGVGDDLEKVEAEINLRNGIIANVDVAGMCEDVVSQLHRQLSRANLS